MACKSCHERRQNYNALHAAKDVLTGDAEYVDKDTYDFRVGICLNCPGNYFNPTFRACNICKCFVKTKAKFKESSCPKDYWGPR
jgi:hypothetical protein